ncbi:MAG: helix-turn-helix transcriptional regulator [Erysipelotrichaceae bacterium]|nr:helix-turn-helix transcriptional regulator [Erysipelotrichaceae bacterium]
MTKNREMMNEKELTKLAELFKVFGDSSRIKILYALFETEMGVGDIADTIDMTISAVSHQLRILKQNHLVKSRRDGKSIFYSLDDDHVYKILAMGKEHIEE